MVDVRGDVLYGETGRRVVRYVRGDVMYGETCMLPKPNLDPYVTPERECDIYISYSAFNLYVRDIN